MTSRPGNLPFSDLVKLAQQDLNAYWKSVLGSTPVTSFVPDAAKTKQCAKGDSRPVAACFRRLRRLQPRKAARGIRQVRRQRSSHAHGRSVGGRGDPEEEAPHRSRSQTASRRVHGRCMGRQSRERYAQDHGTLSPATSTRPSLRSSHIQDTRQHPTTASCGSARSRRASSTGPRRVASSRRDKALGDPHRRTNERTIRRGRDPRHTPPSTCTRPSTERAQRTFAARAAGPLRSRTSAWACFRR